MKKLLFATMALFALCLVGCENGSGQKKSDYVDLGLPSGTKWKAVPNGKKPMRKT